MSFYKNISYNSYRPSLFGGFRFFPPVIKALLVTNGAVYLFATFFGRFHVGDYPLSQLIDSIFALYPIESDSPGMPVFQFWQLFTYMFMHAGFTHLFFNMFALWMFGMELENTWGSRKFFLYYFLCGIGAGVSNLLLGPIFGQGGPTVGASGAIYGILLAFGLMFPERPIFIYFLIPIRAKYFVMIFMAVEVFAGVTGTQDGVAHFAHLGGAAVGFILLMIDSKKIPLSSWLENIKKIYEKPHRYNTANPNGPNRVGDTKFYDIHTGSEMDPNQYIVDKILDKISREGYQKLTDDEKRILFEVSKKIN
jgi:membrane associated rhomboid family serine protease